MYIYIAAHKHGNTQTIWNKISKVLHPIVDEAQWTSLPPSRLFIAWGVALQL